MRNINGVLFLDKISGISSAALLKQVKVIFQARKAGHTGTLDPLATGMLPICFGEATKFSQYLLESDKCYRVVAKLGERTNTFDSCGSVVCVRPVSEINKSYLDHVLSTFIGKNYQFPPVFSALKHCGCPLYKYARRGVRIVKNPRLINIYKIILVKLDNQYIELELHCSTGTYVRTFIDDLGELLGCGAHVTALRRFSIAHFSSKMMVDIKMLQNNFRNVIGDLEYFRKLDELLYPIDILVGCFPEINVSLEICRLLQFGQKVRLDSIVDSDGNKINYDSNNKSNRLVRMTVGYEKRFFGVGSIISCEYLLVHRLLPTCH